MTGKSDEQDKPEAQQFEGFGPNGVAVLVDCMTTSKRRTSAELRKLFAEHGGELGGNVGWKFQARGVIRVGKGSISEETLQAIARDAGAGEILTADPAAYLILTPPAALEGVRGVLEDHEVGVLSADLEQLPLERVGLEDGAARKVLGFLHALEAHADVKRVWSDAELSPELLSDRGGPGA